MVYSYYERLEPGLSRLDDSAWAARLTAGEAGPTVPWLADAMPPGSP